LKTRAGHCQCEGIRFELEGGPTDASFCYCSICRRLSGSAFAAYIEFESSTVRITEGADFLSRYDVTDKLVKRFCSTCGTSLFTAHSDFPHLIYVNLGAIDDHRGIVPRYHQFVGSKAEWYTIADSLPQFEEGPEQ
jgi:hypothetical protein